MPSSLPGRIARAGLALLGWTAVVVWLTWPLASVARTSVPIGPAGDMFYSIWALAWQTHALTTDPARFFDANIYHPAANALAFGQTGTGGLLLFAPVFAATGNPLLAMNVLFVGGTALTAWSIGLVAARWGRSIAAGLVAAAAYLATPWVLYEWVPLCPHYAMLMWLPFIIERAARTPLGLRDATLLAVMIALQAAVEVVYIAPGLFIPLGVIAMVRVARPATRRSGVHLAGAMLAALVALSPLVAAHVAVRRENPNIAEQSPWTADETMAPPTPWSLFGRYPPTGPTSPPMAVPPLAFAAIAGGLLIRVVAHGRAGGDGPDARAWRHAALWTVTAIALSLPSRVTVLGTTVDLPLLDVRESLPLIGVLRDVTRRGVVGLVGASLLAGFGFGEIVRRATPRSMPARWTHVVQGALGMLVGLALLDQARNGWGFPSGFQVRKRPQRYHAVAVQTASPYPGILRADRGPLLEVGMAVFTSDPLMRTFTEPGAMLRSIGHWRPLLNGYGSYWPTQYERSMSLAALLPDDREALRALRAETGVELILVWLDQLPPAKRAAWDAVAAARGNDGLVLVGAGEQRAVLFRVREETG